MEGALFAAAPRGVIARPLREALVPLLAALAILAGLLALAISLPSPAENAGLPVYTATSGLVSAGWGLNVIGSLEGDWSMVGLLRYERLLGDAADSPLVRQRGRADQLTGGLFLSLRL